ncbi:MAG: hypothetical protein CR982_01235 [Candidatus Cloacimonadota bacterium]|nr:MAG: hypothetical protein CR982_01235 [Candidatus Cloacimonadota bacterium]PIE81268.1 MAG: hypothetical protein CSA15_01015 [Candidatus Delongbacteria bacterium]
MKNKGFKLIAFFIITIWSIHFINKLIPIDLRNFGIIPRTKFGSIGIITSPLLHGNINHLISNTMPFLIFSTILVTFFRRNFLRIFITIYLLTGIFVWIFAREAIHIGASSIVYGLAGYLISAGLFKREIILIILSITITIVYGSSMFWGILPLDRFISWEGHLLGGIAGVLTAYMFRNKDV